MFKKEELIISSEVFQNAPKLVQHNVHMYVRLMAFSKRWNAFSLAAFAVAVVPPIVRFIVLLYNDHLVHTTIQEVLIICNFLFFAAITAATDWVSRNLSKNATLLPYGDTLDKLQRLLDYTDDAFYHASVHQLYLAAREKLKSIASEISNAQRNLDEAASETIAEHVATHLLGLREILKVEFNTVKAAGIFDQGAGYDTLFDIQRRQEELTSS
jgi:hypothetical protein